MLEQAPKPLVLHAFKPSAHSAERARANLGTRATVHRIALSDRAGVADLVIVHEAAGSNSLVAFADTRQSSGATETVTLETLDDFCTANDITHVSLLKIDAEGHDLAVMRGATQMLGNHRVDLVQFENNHRWIDARAFLLEAFDLLQGCGYRLGKVTPRGVEVYPRWHHELKTFVEGNYLAYLPANEEYLPTIPWWGG